MRRFEIKRRDTFLIRLNHGGVRERKERNEEEEEEEAGEEEEKEGSATRR